MKKDDTPRPASGQAARDLRLLPTPDGLEVAHIFRRPGAQAFQDFEEALAAVPEIAELAEHGDLSQADFSFAFKTAVERARFKRKRGQERIRTPG